PDARVRAGTEGSERNRPRGSAGRARSGEVETRAGARGGSELGRRREGAGRASRRARYSSGTAARGRVPVGALQTAGARRRRRREAVRGGGREGRRAGGRRRRDSTGEPAPPRARSRPARGGRRAARR